MGRILAGRYRLEESLGKGGSGEVYRATQLDLGREVAVKILLVSQMASTSGLKRFLREAKLAQRLEHPNTVRLYDHGQTHEGLPFIVYQLLHGRPLSKVLISEGALPPALVIRIASQVLKSLMEAHRHDIVHRDIKPENIFLVDFHGEPDFVKVLDFGIAKPTGAEGHDMAATEPDEIIGTPNYMAPEQIEGSTVGPGTDLYALGLVMIEMLTGEVVFADRNPVKVLTAHLSDAPVPLPIAIENSSLGPVIRRATAKAVAHRFADAGEMLGALREAGSALLSAPSAPPYTSSKESDVPREPQRGRLTVAIAGAISLIVIAAVSMILGPRLLCSSRDTRTGITRDSGHTISATVPSGRVLDAEQDRDPTQVEGVWGSDTNQGSSRGDPPPTLHDDHRLAQALVPPEKVAAMTDELMSERLEAAGWKIKKEVLAPSRRILNHVVFKISRSHYKGRASIVLYRNASEALEIAAHHNQGVGAAVSGGGQYVGVSVYDIETGGALPDKAVEILLAIMR